MIKNHPETFPTNYHFHETRDTAATHISVNQRKERYERFFSYLLLEMIYVQHHTDRFYEGDSSDEDIDLYIRDSSDEDIDPIYEKIVGGKQNR